MQAQASMPLFDIKYHATANVVCSHTAKDQFNGSHLQAEAIHCTASVSLTFRPQLLHVSTWGAGPRTVC